MKFIQKSLLITSIAALSQGVNSSIHIDTSLINAELDQEIMSKIHNKSEMATILRSAPAIAETFLLNGVGFNDEEKNLLLIAYKKEDSSGLNGLPTSGPTVDVGVNCYNNCHTNCHGSRSWR